jgi:hypothetical protein
MHACINDRRYNAMLCREDFDLSLLDGSIYLDNAGKTPLPRRVAGAGRAALEHRVRR